MKKSLFFLFSFFFSFWGLVLANPWDVQPLIDEFWWQLVDIIAVDDQEKINEVHKIISMKLYEAIGPWWVTYGDYDANTQKRIDLYEWLQTYLHDEWYVDLNGMQLYENETYGVSLYIPTYFHSWSSWERNKEVNVRDVELFYSNYDAIEEKNNRYEYLVIDIEDPNGYWAYLDSALWNVWWPWKIHVMNIDKNNEERYLQAFVEIVQWDMCEYESLVTDFSSARIKEIENKERLYISSGLVEGTDPNRLEERWVAPWRICAADWFSSWLRYYKEQWVAVYWYTMMWETFWRKYEEHTHWFNWYSLQPVDWLMMDSFSVE